MGKQYVAKLKVQIAVQDQSVKLSPAQADPQSFERLRQLVEYWCQSGKHLVFSNLNLTGEEPEEHPELGVVIEEPPIVIPQPPPPPLGMCDCVLRVGVYEQVITPGKRVSGSKGVPAKEAGASKPAAAKDLGADAGSS